MSDTSAIDEKKENPTSNDDYSSKVISFAISVAVTFIIVLLYFTSSSLILFVCKLAQSNVLPTEANCAPYTNNKPSINPSPIQTNIYTTNADMSMKLEIPYDDYNAKNKLLDMFRTHKEKGSSNFLANYFISIIESLMQFDYSSINTTMNFLNNVPESIIIGLGPILVAILFSFGVLLNGLYFIYLWFSNMHWFFKSNKNESGEGAPKWEDVTLFSPVDWVLSIGLIIVFVILFFVGFPLLSFIPFIILFVTTMSCLFYKGKLNGKNVMAFSLIKETLKHYKLGFVTTLCLSVVLIAFSKLGTVPGIFSLITVFLIYWGILGIDLFNPINESNLTPLSSYEQATKKCSNVLKNTQKHGLLYNFIFGQKGGNITKQLKKIGKNI